MAYQLTAQDLLEAALLGSAMGSVGRSRAGLSGVVSPSGSSEDVLLGAISRMTGPSMPIGAAGVTGAPGAPGQALRNQAPRKLLTPADVQRIRSQYGAKEYPQTEHVVRTERANGTHNAGLDRSIASDAARMQNLQFHNDTLFKYLRPGMDQRTAHEAIKQGYKEEAKVPAYWDDFRPRKDMHVHSDAVHAIRITPDACIEIKWRGKPSKNNPSGWYTFRQFPDTHAASMAAKELIMSDSLGHAVMPYQRKGKPVKLKPGWGWWNRKNYDGAFAG